MAFDHLPPPDLSGLCPTLETGRVYAVRTADSAIWLGWAAFTELSPVRIALDLRSHAAGDAEGSALYDLVLEGGGRARLLHGRGLYLACRVMPDPTRAAQGLTLLPERGENGVTVPPQILRSERGGLVFGTKDLPIRVGPGA